MKFVTGAQQQACTVWTTGSYLSNVLELHVCMVVVRQLQLFSKQMCKLHTIFK